MGSSLGIRFIPSNVSPGEYLNETDTTYSNAGNFLVRFGSQLLEFQFALADDGVDLRWALLSVPSKGASRKLMVVSISVELLDGAPVTSKWSQRI